MHSSYRTVSRKTARILDEAIQSWRKDGMLSEEASQKLKDSYVASAFSWRQVSRYSFLLAIFCFAAAIVAVFADAWIIALFERLFDAPDAMKSLSFAVISGFIYFYAIRRMRQFPDKQVSNEMRFLAGAVTTAAAIAFLWSALFAGSCYSYLLVLLATLIYGLLGAWLLSPLLWLLSLLTLIYWFGAQTDCASNVDAYWLGMNFQLRHSLFGVFMVLGGAYVFNRWPSRQTLRKATMAISLAWMFMSLWMLSITGNFDPYWYEASKLQLSPGWVLFAIAGAVAIYYGVKHDDAITRGFGIVAIFLNLYTRYVECFWDLMHKAIFFGILALSFWYLGMKAEKIWRLTAIRDRINKGTRQPANP